MSAYAALLILAMKTGFTVAAAFGLNTENPFEFCYWNGFNPVRFTLKNV